jgi:hypothetical protein
MTMLLSRRAVLAGASSCLIARAPAFAQEELTQTSEGEGTYWAPVISALYAEPEQGSPSLPEGDGPPEFPENVTQPPLKFTLNPSPADRAANIDTDWTVYDMRRRADEHVSAIVMAKQFNKPRLWLHRCRDEEYMAGYGESRRLFLITNAAVVRERFPIEGQPSSGARPGLIRDRLKVVGGKVAVEELAKVRPNGAGGEVVGEPLFLDRFANLSLAEFGSRPRSEFVPRFETTPEGELLNGVLKISLEMEFEAGTDLGLTEPERAKVYGEIRVAVGKEYVDFMKIYGANIQIAK